MSTFLTDTEIERVARGLIDRSLPKSEWTHAAHFASALWLLRQGGLRAMREMPPLISAYNEATGVANTDTSGYHETITLASLRAAHHWLLSRPDAPLHGVLGEMLASRIGRSDWLLTYWSKPLLFSVTARRSWVEPDLAPLPFGDNGVGTPSVVRAVFTGYSSQHD
jgi:hypothetical protein